MDLGHFESAAWENRYSVWGQGKSGEGVDEIPKYEEGEEGLCTLFWL